MSLHPVPAYPSSTSSELDASRVPADADERLEVVARALHRTASDGGGPTHLVGLVDAGALVGEPDAAGHPDHLVLTALDDPDPATLLLGRTAPAELWAVGVAAGVRTRPLDDLSRADDAAFVHLVDRRGCSVAVLGPPGTAPAVTGPHAEPALGRIADACRRMLGLPTAPPPGDMTTHVVDLWLARVTRAALSEPGLDWPAVVALNPSLELPRPSTVVPTPAATARRTVELGRQLDWDRYRLRCVEAGGTPFGELTADDAAWMDAGMFARWMLGESMAWTAHLDLLEGLVSPGAIDRLWATVGQCPDPCGPR